MKKKLGNILDRFADALAHKISQRLDTGAISAATDAPGSGPEGVSTVTLDYAFHPRPRWGEAWKLPVHPELRAVIRAADSTINRQLDLISSYGDFLRKIPESASDPREPHWVNGWLPGWDGAAIYAFIAEYKPATYLEVGSGNSTKFARRAVEEHSTATRIISVDPYPRAEVDTLCDTVIRSPFEDVEIGLLLSSLVPGDMVFIDNSHRSFQNSDVTVSLLELLPRLPEATVVGLHDIFLPDDYPAEWSSRCYNEQYMLAAFLLGGHHGTEILLPAFDASRREEMCDRVNGIWTGDRFSAVERHGGAFWLRTVARKTDTAGP